MLMPSIFGENLFDDDWMNFPFNDEFWGKKNPLYGKHAQNMMKTDIRETNGSYELDVDLPGFKKDEIQVQLKDGYLVLSAAKGLDKDEKDKETTKKLSMDIPIEKQNLQEETWNLIAMIYLKYLCEDEKEKKELEQIYDENEKKYREEMKEKYNPEKILENRGKKNIVQQEEKNLPIKVQKESIIQKIIKFINKLFHKKNT
jgi:hypothetical protein